MSLVSQSGVKIARHVIPRVTWNIRAKYFRTAGSSVAEIMLESITASGYFAYLVYEFLTVRTHTIRHEIELRVARAGEYACFTSEMSGDDAFV